MSVSIKVAIRCRPFTKKDRLGLIMNQVNEDEGEVSYNIISYHIISLSFT